MRILFDTPEQKTSFTKMLYDDTTYHHLPYYFFEAVNNAETLFTASFTFERMIRLLDDTSIDTFYNSYRMWYTADRQPDYALALAHQDDDIKEKLIRRMSANRQAEVREDIKRLEEKGIPADRIKIEQTKMLNQIWHLESRGEIIVRELRQTK